MLKGICLVISSASAVLMTVNLLVYYRYIRSLKNRHHNRLKKEVLMQYLPLVMMGLLLTGYILDPIDTFLREFESYFIFIATVFFFGAVYIALSINNHIAMTKVDAKQKMEVLNAFINAAELKDPYTKGHSKHVFNLVCKFYDYLPNRYKKMIRKDKLLQAALLHDIGKIGIPDSILNKSGKLNDEEWEIMKSHPLAAKKVLDDSFLYEISDWVLYHHERVDGNGYYKLKAGDIPFESKIISIADAYSALCSNRSYRNKCSHDDALKILKTSAGTQFDEELITYFCLIDQPTLETCLEYPDSL